MESSFETQNKKINFSNFRPKQIIIILALIVLAAFSGYFYLQYQNANNLLKNPSQASDQEAKAIVSKVGKLMLLPTDENPTIATVSDATKLSDQQFFRNALNGDKVLIFSKAKQAILYRPSINKIIEVAPINLGQNQPASPVVPTLSIQQKASTPSSTTTPSVNSGSGF